MSPRPPVLTEPVEIAKFWKNRQHDAIVVSLSGYGGKNFAGVRDATSLEEAVRIARKINWRVNYERTQAATAKREAHLRALMGLPATPRRDPDGDEA